jgi:hypothetical protein
VEAGVVEVAGMAVVVDGATGVTRAVSHPDFRGPKPGCEHNHQVCWDQVSHI